MSIKPNIVRGILTERQVEKIMDKINSLTNDSLFMSEVEAREWVVWEEKSREADAIKRGFEKGMK